MNPPNKPENTGKPKQIRKKGRKPGPGRKTLYTPELGSAIIESVRRHGTDFAAAEAVGVHRDTLYNWRKRGRDNEEPFAEWVANLDAARSEFIQKQLIHLGRSKEDKTRLRLIELIEPAFRPPSKFDIQAEVKTENTTTVTLSPEQLTLYRRHVLGLPE